jgi:perosamine synthetase
MIQYGRQTIDDSDIEAISNVLRENTFLTTGPKVAEFEQAVCHMIGSKYAFAVNSGTAALHLATRAIRLMPGDQVIVPAITFAATANCVLYEGATPVFCDVDPHTLNLDVGKVLGLITPSTKAIIMVDYAGQPADYHELRRICDEYNLVLIEDAAHSIGHRVSGSVCPAAPYIGSFADITTFSFHPVKNMTTGEGGMTVTNNPLYASRMKTFRTHGISTEYGERKLHGYDIVELGYNYRITDFQCALGLNQLRRVEDWIRRRQEIVQQYDMTFGSSDVCDLIKPVLNRFSSCYHIYVILLQLELLDCDRDQIFSELKNQGIGVNVHYKPVYLMTYYQNHPGLETRSGLCPVAEDAYMRMITIPLYPTMTQEQIDKVCNVVKSTVMLHRLK